MTIEEYRDKHFPEYGNITFAKNIRDKYSYYSLGSSGDKIVLFSDASIAIESYHTTIVDQEMMSDLKKLIRTYKNFKKWKAQQ